MKRRTFLQWILGIVGLTVTGLSKEKTETEDFAGIKHLHEYQVQKIQDWHSNYIDFGEEIHDMRLLPDDNSLLIICAHSLWVVTEEIHGPFKRLLWVKRKIFEF